VQDRFFDNDVLLVAAAGSRSSDFGADARSRPLSLAYGGTYRFQKGTDLEFIPDAASGDTKVLFNLGNLISNGRVFLINPNGMVFGPKSVVDTAGFVGSTLNMTDKDFLSGKFAFKAGPKAGKLVNQGLIRSRGKGGEIVVTSNSTTSEAETARIDVSGNAGGRVSNLAGEKFATSANYSADGNDGEGGHIDVSAPEFELADAAIDASGQTGGGTVCVGGEYQGGKDLETDELPNARALCASAGTHIKADALESGDGGEVIVWSDEATRFLGTISARGGGRRGIRGLPDLARPGIGRDDRRQRRASRRPERAGPGHVRGRRGSALATARRKRSG